MHTAYDLTERHPLTNASQEKEIVSLTMGQASADKRQTHAY